MEAKDIAGALRARWWLPLLGLLLGGAAAALLVAQSTPLYTSTTQFFVSTAGSTSASEALQGGQFSEQRVASYAELLRGPDLAAAVIDRLGLDETAEELSSRLTVTALPETVLVSVSVEDPSAEQAQRIAAAVGEEFGDLVASLERADSDGDASVVVSTTQEPVVPDEPSSPQSLRLLAIGLGGGLLLGAVGAVVRARLDRSVSTTEQAVAAAGAPVLGVVVRDRGLRSTHVAGGQAAEDFRRLRTNLQFLDVDTAPRVLMVSSALPGEGKTTTAVNLALSLAESGQRVVLVEADLRRPKAVEYLNLVPSVGLTQVLTGRAELGDVTQVVGEVGLEVIGAGPLPPNPGELLGSARMARLVTELRERYDYVLFDAPPLLPVADAAGLAPLMDGVLVSVRHRWTSRGHLREAADTLTRVNARPLGVVVGMVSGRSPLAAAQGRTARYGYALAR
ncbi:polysaccharide biosynthesis tyrosine autokinase [Blastococcus sp. URHD0036]|uniref:polysaccharide biosynthesis tyrosine autokinase n=1 Tax=Blastococcus sp. URHD0036 TaxID=1380356 RepID=UPI0006915B5F|nr:polysaccharide biosynthesis tyrosine autokinase [Blastococcus sp. URHD0036]